MFSPWASPFICDFVVHVHPFFPASDFHIRLDLYTSLSLCCLKYDKSLFMVGIHCMPQFFMMVLHQNSLSVRGDSENSFRLCQEFTSKMPPAKSAICNKGNFGEVVRGWISQEKKLSPLALFPAVWQPRCGQSLICSQCSSLLKWKSSGAIFLISHLLSLTPGNRQATNLFSGLVSENACIYSTWVTIQYLMVY